MTFQYLLREVQPEEYRSLKKDEKRFVEETMKGFNDHWRPKTRNVQVGFKYNSDRDAVGIFLQRKGGEQLVLDPEGLTEAENAVVGSLYNKLQERLARLRIPKEKWE